MCSVGFDLNRVIRGRVWKFGDSIETDAINPYYRYPTMAELKQHTMEAYRPEFPKEVKAGDVMVAGRTSRAFFCATASTGRFPSSSRRASRESSRMGRCSKWTIPPA
jgi:hypothetical protein